MDVNELLEDIMKETGERRKVFDYPIQSTRKRHIISQMLPVTIQIYDQTMPAFSRISNGETITTTGYLVDYNAMGPMDKIRRWEEKYNLPLHDGLKLMSFFAETTHIPTEVMVVCPIQHTILSGLPHELVLKKLGDHGYKRYFVLEDFKETILKPQGDLVKLPTLSLKGMVKSMVEVSPSFNPSNPLDAHSIRALFSPFIGCNVSQNEVDGIGSSYMADANLSAQLRELERIITSSDYSIPLSHLGTINNVRGDYRDFLRLRKEKLGKLRLISWNIPAGNLGVVKNSEFNYATHKEIIMPEKRRDLEGNLDLQQSILLYNITDKTLPSSQLSEIVLEADQQILDLLGKGHKEIIPDIMEAKRLPVQVAKLGSFYYAFNHDKEFVLKMVRETVMHNIEDMVHKEILEKLTGKRRMRAESSYDASVPHGIRIAIMGSDETEQGIMDRFCKILGVSQKRAKKMFEEMHKEAFIYTHDGIHYRLTDWHGFKLK